MSPVATSTWLLNPCRTGALTTCLGSLCHGWTTQMPNDPSSAKLPPAVQPMAPLFTSLFLRGRQHPNSGLSQDSRPKYRVKDKFKSKFSWRILSEDEVDHVGRREALQRSCWQGGGWCDNTLMLQHWHLFWDQTKCPKISCEHMQPLSMSTLSTAENRRGARLKRQFTACFTGRKKPKKQQKPNKKQTLAACFKVQQGTRTLSTGKVILSTGTTMLAGHLNRFMHQFLRSSGGGELLPSQPRGKGTNKPLQNRSICREQMWGWAVQPQAPAARGGITLIPIYHTPAQ